MKYILYPSRDVLLKQLRARRDAFLADKAASQKHLDDYESSVIKRLDDAAWLQNAVDRFTADAARVERLIELAESSPDPSVKVEVEDET